MESPKLTARENIGPRWRRCYQIVIPICQAAAGTLLAPVLVLPIVLKLIRELYREQDPPWKRKETRHPFRAMSGKNRRNRIDAV